MSATATDADKAVVHRALQMIAGACDGAGTRDGTGFGKFDVKAGKELAFSPEIPEDRLYQAAQLANKYRRQLPGYMAEAVDEIADRLEQPQSTEPPFDILAVPWSEPKVIATRRGEKRVREWFVTGQSFWEEWRKGTLKAAGYSVSKYGGQWKLTEWRNVDGGQTETNKRHAEALEKEQDMERHAASYEPALKGASAQRFADLESKLLPFQSTHVKRLVNALESFSGAVDTSDTGTGKTFTALAAVTAMGMRAFVVSPKSVLPSWGKAAEHFGIDLQGAINYEKLRTGKTEFGRYVPQGKGKKFVYDEEALDPEEVVIVFDECFPGWTPVNVKHYGPVPIAKVLPGMAVETPLGWRVVNKVHELGQRSEFIIITDESGAWITCTPEHKILTDCGYKKAANLSTTDYLYRHETIEALFPLRKTFHGEDPVSVEAQTLLLSELSEQEREQYASVQEAGFREYEAQHAERWGVAAGRAKANEYRESLEAKLRAAKNIRDAQTNRTQAANPRWKRNDADQTAIGIIVNLGAEMGRRVLRIFRCAWAIGQSLAAYARGLGPSSVASCRGNRREYARRKEERDRRAERRDSRTNWLANDSLHERSTCRFLGFRGRKTNYTKRRVVSVEKVSRPLETVYDLTIEGVHCYIASGVVVSNCHRMKDYKTLNCGLGIAAIEQDYTVLALSATAADNPLQMKFVATLTGLVRHAKMFFGWLTQNGCQRGRFGMEFVGGRQILTRLHSQIFPAHGSRIRIVELGDAFPETKIIAEAYDMNGAREEIAEIYREMHRELAQLQARKEEDKNAENHLTVMLRARQKVELLKVPTICQMAEDGVAEGMSVVVILNFADSLAAVSSRLKTLNLIHGGQDDGHRELIRARFDEDKENLIVMNIRAGGVGISLHGTRESRPRLVLISPTFSGQDLKQAFGRAWRAGGARSIQKVLFAAGTIEEEACDRVREKIARIDTLNGDELETALRF